LQQGGPNVTRTGRRFIRTAALLAALGPAGEAAVAQTPAARPAAAATAGPPKKYTKNPAFRLPVQIAEKDREQVKELKFFWKAVPGEWACQEVAPPTQTSFTFTAPQDGEYWFGFVTVDLAGRSMPASLDKAGPGLIVV